MKDNNKIMNNTWIVITIIFIIALVILAQIFIVPKLFGGGTEESDIDSDVNQSIEYMEISLSEIENKLDSKSDNFKVMEEVRLDNGLHRLIVQGRGKEDRVVLEVIGNKALDKITSIYLITWNSEENSEDATNIDTKYMIELLNIIFPEFRNSQEWLEESLGELGASQIVKVIDDNQIGLMSMDGFQTVGLSIIPSIN